MKNLDPQTPIWQLTVAEFLEVSKNISAEKKYEYGLKGLAKILGCSVSKASEVKSSGILDKAIIQNGNIIIIDKEKALQLSVKNNECITLNSLKGFGYLTKRQSQVRPLLQCICTY